MATPRVAAGALLVDDDDRPLLVKPTYKDGWDVPGGYVEPGESPRAACIREVLEELGIAPPLGRLLVVDWAPSDLEGDKLLFLFDGGRLDQDTTDRIRLATNELERSAHVDPGNLADHLAPRLARRVSEALAARTLGQTLYLEHGRQPTAEPSLRDG
jgi:ADP-ribose pyrophosphatase YjhB (NUDIX family)